MTEDAVEIRRIIAAQASAWNRGDGRGWSADCDLDLGFTNILGMRWDTRDGFEARHTEMFRGPFAGSQLVMEVERLRFPIPEVAIAELLTRLTHFVALPPGIRPTADGLLETRMVEVLTKREGRWRIAACHNTAVMPPRGDRP